MASAAEREIRDCLVDWWHDNHPRGRVIHELPLGSFSHKGRADLAVAFPDTLVLIEIKSEKDKLTRLEKQFHAMSHLGHDWKIVCHEKWFDDDGNVVGQDWVNWAAKEHFWRYPELKKWEYDCYSNKHTPHSLSLLELLHREELVFCYNKYKSRFPAGKATRYQMKQDLFHRLTGREVREAVCDRLRVRNFAEADQIVEKAA